MLSTFFGTFTIKVTQTKNGIPEGIPLRFEPLPGRRQEMADYLTSAPFGMESGTVASVS